VKSQELTAAREEFFTEAQEEDGSGGYRDVWFETEEVSEPGTQARRLGLRSGHEM